MGKDNKTIKPDLGQIWEVKEASKIQHLHPRSLLILLSKEGVFWNVGNYYVSRDKKLMGASIEKLTNKEIETNADYKCRIQSLVKIYSTQAPS